MSTFTIHAIPALNDNYIWAVIDSNQAQALIVDPGDAVPVIAFLEQNHLSLAGILITHHHWDHTNGVIALKKTYPDIPVFGPNNQSIAGLTHALHENEMVKLPEFPLTFKVLSIPGHTLDHIAYYAPNLLFCGDTLFAGGCGRLFEGTATQLYASLQKIAGLPETTKIYCAHEYTLNNLRFAEQVEPVNSFIHERLQQISANRQGQPCTLPSTLLEEKRTNPFLRCASPEVRQSVEQYANQRLTHDVDVFTWLRRWKDSVT